MIFTQIKHVELPETVEVGKGFIVVAVTDGEVPFPQLIIHHADGWEWIVKEQQVTCEGEGRYRFEVPPEAYHVGTAYLQIEGCRKADIGSSSAKDWIKLEPYPELHVTETVASGSGLSKSATVKFSKPFQEIPQPTVTVRLGQSQQPVVYFGIHKHMHQPYYNAVDVEYWDGEKDQIFGNRVGAYTHYIPTAVQQYINGGLAHAGLSTSWSGSLIEQLNRCAEKGRCGGVFGNWNQGLRNIAQNKTALGNPRVDFVAFGFHHPLMALIPNRDIIGQIEWHRHIVREAFGVEASDVMFPPETAFHPHMIPALKEAGVKAVIYDSIHHFRACQEYPYGGKNEGMLPPNLADQENPPVTDWLQLQNIWAASKISPQLLKPCILRYTDHVGKNHDIIGVPAERYLGNEDARGGYGALQYESVMGQIYNHIVRTKTYDPKHPPFFILHSDGDNHGGGADSYYGHNTAGLVRMCQTDARFQLITIKDYLASFPVDPNNVVHLEPGSWAGADNGDPQFTKWFSWVEKDYSPDLNSWAILTALQNVVYSLEDTKRDTDLIVHLKRLLYTAETSCYWYWTGQEVWDAQVTHAANKSMEMAGHALATLQQAKKVETTPPTIFVPWIRPANPGGQDWGPGGLVKAAEEATVRTFVYDISGVKKVTFHYYVVGDAKTEKRLAMKDCGAYPSRTNPAIISHLYELKLPAKTGNIRYYITAEDNKGNVGYSTVGRIYIA